jgi:Mce-associated membrane protein
MTTTDSPPDKTARRRAVRAAGPAKGDPAQTTTVRVDKSVEKPARRATSGAPPRRPAHRRPVAIAALVCVSVATLTVGAEVAALWIQKNDDDQIQARNQQFVDAAAQTLVNMYTFKPDSVEQSVDQFYGETSGPLRDEWSRDNHIANLKTLLRATGNSSEAVVNGAALETPIDSVSNNAAVLVSLRVTQSDTNGNNKPSLPMRWRVVVHEDFDTHKMTAYDMRYPDGGN